VNRANSFRPFYAQAITWTVVLSTIVFLLYAAFPAPVNAEPDFRESPKFIKEAGRIEALIDAAVNQEKPCKCDVRKLLKLLQELLENEEQLKRKNADISQSLAKTRQKLLEAAEQESRSGETSFTKTVAWSALNLLMDVTLDQADKAFDFGTKSLNELGTGIRTVKGGARVAGKFLGKGASKGGQIGKVAYDYLGSAGANADRLKKYPELNAAEASIRKMGENQAESMENKRLEQLIWNKILGSPGCLEALNTQCSLADIEYVSKRGVLNQLDKVSYPYLNFVIHDIERVADTYGYRAFPGKDYEEKGFSHAELKKYVMPKLELYQYFDEQAYKYNAVAGQSIAAAGRASEKCNTCKMLKALKGLSDLKSEIDVLENDWKGVYVGTIRGVIGSHKALAKMWAAKGSPAKITSHPLYQLEGLALSLVSVTTPVGTAMSAAAAVSEISQAVGDLVFKAPVTEDIKRQAKLMKVFADSLNNSIGALADTSNRIEKARADLIRRLFDCNKIKTCPKEKPVSYPAPQYRSVERHPVAIPGHGSLSPGSGNAGGLLIPGAGGTSADCDKLANELRSLEKQREQLGAQADVLHKQWTDTRNRIPGLEKEIAELAGDIRDANQLMGKAKPYYVGGSKATAQAALKKWTDEKNRKQMLAHQLRIREAKLRYQKDQLSKRERNLHNHIIQVRRALENCRKKAPAEPFTRTKKREDETPAHAVDQAVGLDTSLAGLYTTPNGELLIRVSVNGAMIEGQAEDVCEAVLRAQGKEYQAGDSYFKGTSHGNEIQGRIHVKRIDTGILTGIREPECMARFRDRWDNASFYFTKGLKNQRLPQLKIRHKSRSMNMACKVHETAIDTLFLTRFRGAREQFRKNCIAARRMNPELKPVPIVEMPDMQSGFDPPEPPPQLLEPDPIPDIVW